MQSAPEGNSVFGGVDKDDSPGITPLLLGHLQVLIPVLGRLVSRYRFDMKLPRVFAPITQFGCCSAYNEGVRLSLL